MSHNNSNAAISKFIRLVFSTTQLPETHVYNLHEITENMCSSAAKQPRNPKQVVFVADWPRSREARLAYGLKKAGWDVILLYKNQPTFDPAGYFSRIHQYKDPVDALSLATSYTPVVYHVFSNWDFTSALAFIIYKPGKIVFDDYDVFAGMLKKDKLNEQDLIKLDMERLCLENADGLCCRSLETQYAKRKLGYSYRGKRIFFPEYCWNLNNHNNGKSDINSFVIANVGNLYIDKHRHLDDPNNYHLYLALIFAKNNIASYLFKTHLNYRDVSFVNNVTGNNPLIKISQVSYEKLMDELYHFCDAGLICAPPDITASEHELYSQNKRNYAIGNKAFDYIDAGLTVIMDTENKFLFWFIKRYHKVIDFSVFMSDIDKYLGLIRAWQSAGSGELLHASQVLSVSRHIPRLTRFYEDIQ